ncbi:hypothetical protein [Aliikangiella maris]|uniref:Uncharacterized protein n=2 Tax=Aliikangiella maris TaxID=3162458 RepID=A0ABV3MUV9_9GAMM
MLDWTYKYNNLSPTGQRLLRTQRFKRKISRLCTEPNIGRIIWGVVMLLTLALVILGIGGLLELPFANKLESKFDISPWSFLLTIGLFSLIVCVLYRKKNHWISWPAFITTLWIIYSTWGYSLLGEVKTPHKIYQSMQQHISANIELALVNFSEQFILFSPYPITHFGYATDNQQQFQAVYAWQHQSTNRLILTDFATLSTTLKGICFDPQKVIHLGFAHRKDWVLLTSASRLADCPKTHEQLIKYQYFPINLE